MLGESRSIANWKLEDRVFKYSIRIDRSNSLNFKFRDLSYVDFSDLLLLLNWTWEINCELISECSILKWKLVLNFKNSNSWSNSYSTSFWSMIICVLNLDHKLFVVRKVICFFIPVLLVERLSSQLHSKQCCHYIYFSISRFICKKISFCVFFARDDKEIEKCIFCVFYFFIMEKVKMLFRREKSYVKSMKKKVYE